MIYTSHYKHQSGSDHQSLNVKKEKRILRKYGLYAAGIFAALVLGTGGCASNASAQSTSTSASQETTGEETAAEDATVVESVTGAIESTSGSQNQTSQLTCIYGPASKTEEGMLSIDNQSGAGYSGEINLNISPDHTYILDAVTGLPVQAEDIKDGDTIYAYIGPAMTMSLPPMTNAEVIFTNIQADQKVPSYAEVKSLVTDAASSKSILTTADGTEYTLAPDCSIFPYLTKNIVTMDDLTQGRKCVIWSDNDNNAQKIMLFAE